METKEVEKLRAFISGAIGRAVGPYAMDVGRYYHNDEKYVHGPFTSIEIETKQIMNYLQYDAKVLNQTKDAN